MSIDYLERENGPHLAYVHTPATDKGAGLPAVMFLCGFRSDMEGTKATYLEAQCKARGQAYVRFDYRGHGASGGDFTDGTISLWRDDALAMLDEVIAGDAILVGSSMGGWIALLAALARPEKVKGLIGLAAAPDFTREIYHERMTDDQRAMLDEQGSVDVPNDYSDAPYRIVKNLIDDGERHCLLDGEIDVKCPVRLIQGMQDADVEWQKAHRVKNAITHDDVKVILREQGDHRLSGPEDLELIDGQVRELSGLEGEKNE